MGAGDVPWHVGLGLRGLSQSRHPPNGPFSSAAVIEGELDVALIQLPPLTSPKGSPQVLPLPGLLLATPRPAVGSLFRVTLPKGPSLTAFLVTSAGHLPLSPRGLSPAGGSCS